MQIDNNHYQEIRMLEKLFKLSEHGTTARTEILAGIATFLTMAYILIVNPAILADAGFPHEGVFIATIIAAVVACLIMGLYANWPIGLAPGMGLNAFVAYTLSFPLGIVLSEINF